MTEESWTSSRLVSSLGDNTLTRFSEMLYETKVIRSPSGWLRDWRGLAEQLGLDNDAVSRIRGAEDKFRRLINNCTINLEQLYNFLVKMDRFDVIDDLTDTIERDLQRPGPLAYSLPVLPTSAQEQFLTIDDREHFLLTGSLAQYDALVLFSEHDRHFAEELISKMGDRDRRMCTKELLMAGFVFECSVLLKLMERCRFLIPIFSPDFLGSTENTFVCEAVNSSVINKNERRIIPCVYRQCELPETMRGYSKLNYTSHQNSEDFWERMFKSITVDESAERTVLTEDLGETVLTEDLGGTFLTRDSVTGARRTRSSWIRIFQFANRLWMRTRARN